MMYMDFRDAEYNIQAEPMDYLQCEQATLQAIFMYLWIILLCLGRSAEASTKHLQDNASRLQNKM